MRRSSVVDTKHCAPFFAVVINIVLMYLEGDSEGGEAEQAEPFADVMGYLFVGPNPGSYDVWLL